MWPRRQSEAGNWGCLTLSFLGLLKGCCSTSGRGESSLTFLAMRIPAHDGQEPGLPHQHGLCVGYHLSELCPRVSRGCPESRGLPVCCCTGSDGVNAGAAIRAGCQGLSPAQHSCGAWGDVLPISPVALAQHTGTVFQHSLYNKLQLEDSTHRGWEQLALILTCACFLFLLLYRGSHDSGVHPLLLCSRDEPSLVPSYPFPKPRHIPRLLPVAALLK